jgi:UDP-N-acetylglucosamine--N-acetylmuramyl-(pentapeptide) pyrophosphoryl-undecaprenol N-acetylglucosamine transferase
LAVADELKKLQSDIGIVYIGQKGDSLADVPAEHPSIDQAFGVRAGKFRRYYGEGWHQLLDIPTVAKNIRDAFYVLAGIWQSYWLLRRLKPDVVFIKGGFVGVPVGIAARLHHVPFITHDSDAIPGLANRIIARWASLHAVALPADIYPYPRAKTMTVGVPVSGNYRPVTPQLMRQYRAEAGLDAYEQVMMVTGGGNGARDLNTFVISNAAHLLKRYPKLAIVHLTGRALEAEATAAYTKALPPDFMERIIIKGFVTDMYRYSGAADVIVARGSATNLAEFAVQAKACVIIPAQQLIWTVRNTEEMAKRNAIVYLNHDQAAQEQRLGTVIAELLDDNEKRQSLATQLSTFGVNDAAKRLAMLLLEQVTDKQK